MTSTVADFNAPFAPGHFDCDTMQSHLDALADQETDRLRSPIAESQSRGASEEPEAPLPSAAHVLEVARSVLICVAGGDAEHQLVDPITLSCGHSLCKVRRARRAALIAQACLSAARRVPTDAAEPTLADRAVAALGSAFVGASTDRSCLCPVEACRTASVARPSLQPGKEPRIDVVLQKTLDHIRRAESAAEPPESLAADLLGDLECHICATLLHRPLSLTCGHTFCTQCLARSLDHAPSCPLDRSTLPGAAWFNGHARAVALSELIRRAYGATWAQREAADIRQRQVESSQAPLFICSLSMPTLPTSLHVFEPRCACAPRREQG